MSYLDHEEEDAFSLIYDQVKEKWKLNDPYLRDPEGLRKAFRKAYDEYEEQVQKRDEQRRLDFEKIVETPWLEQLKELAPRHKGIRLEDRIYKEILVDGEKFTEDKKDEYKENIDLLIKLKFAYGKFVKEHGPFTDMFGEWVFNVNGSQDSTLGQFPTPETVCDFMVRSVTAMKDLNTVMSWLDPCCGTGRFMLRTAKYYADEVGKFNFIFFNQDIDHRMYVYTAMQAILNDIPSLTIWGNTLMDEKREAILTVPLFPGYTPWRIIPEENVPLVQSALLTMIEKEQQQG